MQEVSGVSRTKKGSLIPRCQEWGNGGSGEERSRTLGSVGGQGRRRRRSGGDRAGGAAGTGGGGRGRGGPVGEAAALAGVGGGGVGGLDGLELCLGRVVPVEVVLLLVDNGWGRDRRRARTHGCRARRRAAG